MTLPPKQIGSSDCGLCATAVTTSACLPLTSEVRRHTDLSSTQKLDIIYLSSEKVSQAQPAQQFNSSQSTISKLLKERKKLFISCTLNHFSEALKGRLTEKADDIR